MRLVSQNGEFDVPYEIAALSRTGNIIRAYVSMVGEKRNGHGSLFDRWKSHAGYGNVTRCLS